MGRAPVLSRRFVVRLVTVTLVTAGFGLALADPGIWRSLFVATFTGVADGPGDGVTFPAELGRLRTFVEAGLPFRTVAPASGIVDERLYLDDTGGVPGIDFGVEAVFNRSATNGVGVYFEIRIEKPGTSFSAEIADTSGVDIARVSFCKDGSVDVSEIPNVAHGRPSVNYGVELLLSPVSDKGVLILTNLDVGQRLGAWSFPLEGGYRPAGSLVLTNLGATAGSVSLDNILAYEPK